MNLKPKFLKESQVENGFSEKVDVIKVITKKDNAKLSVSKRVLTLKNDRLSLISKSIPKNISRNKIVCNLCLKHARLINISEPNQLIDSILCRSLVDPLGNEIILRFISSERVSIWERRLERYQNNIIKMYNELTSEIIVINEASDTQQGNFKTIVKGDTNGAEIKRMAEEKFNMHGLLSLKYSLEMQYRQHIVSVIDELPIFYLDEFMSNYTRPMICSENCKHKPKEPSQPITMIVLDKANKQRKNFKPDKVCKRTKKGLDLIYNIEERWHEDLLPTWLLRLLSDIYFRGGDYKGIFRTCSVGNKSHSYYELMLTRDDFYINDTLYTKASVLKHFIGKISDGLLKLSLAGIKDIIYDMRTSEKFLKHSKNRNKIINLLATVPRQRFRFLQFLLVVFKAIVDSKETLMDPYNLGVVFAMTVFSNIEQTEFKNNEMAHQLTILIECIIRMTDTIVDSETVRSIVEIFSQYKTDPNALPLAVGGSSTITTESSSTSEKLSDDENRSSFINCENSIDSFVNVPRRRLQRHSFAMKIISPRSTCIVVEENNPSVEIPIEENCEMAQQPITEVLLAANNEKVRRTASSSSKLQKRRKLRNHTEPMKINHEEIILTNQNKAGNIVKRHTSMVENKRKVEIVTNGRSVTRHQSENNNNDNNATLTRKRRKKSSIVANERMECSDVPSLAVVVDKKKDDVPATVTQGRHSSMFSISRDVFLELTNHNNENSNNNNNNNNGNSTKKPTVKRENNKKVKVNRSRSPYVKSMVAMYERRLRSQSLGVENQL